MEITFVRHTKVDVPKGIVYGQTDVSLAQSFNNEVLPIQKQLDNLAFDHIFSSPLSRCRLLADILSKGNRITFDDRLKELNFGDWEQKTWDHIYQSSPEWFDNYLTQACPHGESYTNLIARCQSFLNSLLQKKHKRKVLVVSHAGPIRAMTAIMDGISPENSFEIKVDYGEIITRQFKQIE